MKLIWFLLAILSGAAAVGCGGLTWEFGHHQSFSSNGWNIRLQNVPDDAVVRSDFAATINTGGHTIVVKNGVSVDGRQIATGPSGEVTITQNIGTVSVAVNGHPVETD